MHAHTHTLKKNSRNSFHKLILTSPASMWQFLCIPPFFCWGHCRRKWLSKSRFGIGPQAMQRTHNNNPPSEDVAFKLKPCYCHGQCDNMRQCPKAFLFMIKKIQNIRLQTAQKFTILHFQCHITWTSPRRWEPKHIVIWAAF